METIEELIFFLGQTSAAQSVLTLAWNVIAYHIYHVGATYTVSMFFVVFTHVQKIVETISSLREESLWCQPKMFAAARAAATRLLA